MSPEPSESELPSAQNDSRAQVAHIREVFSECLPAPSKDGGGGTRRVKRLQTQAGNGKKKEKKKKKKKHAGVDLLP